MEQENLFPLTNLFLLIVLTPYVLSLLQYDKVGIHLHEKNEGPNLMNGGNNL